MSVKRHLVEALVQVTCTPSGEQSFSLGLRSQAGAALSVGDRATCRDNNTLQHYKLRYELRYEQRTSNALLSL